MRSLTRSPYVSFEAVPLPLAVKDSIPMLALPAPRRDPQIEEVEQRLGATQLGFQEAMLRQFQNITDQMVLLIKNRQPGPRPQIESSNHSSGFWCTECQQHGHTPQFCRNGPNRNQRMNNNGPQQNQRGPNQNQTKEITGVLLVEVKITKILRRKNFTIFAGGIML